MPLLAYFLVQNFKKILGGEDLELRTHRFQVQNVPSGHNENFFEKNNLHDLHVVLVALVRNFKQILRAHPQLRGCVILGS